MTTPHTHTVNFGSYREAVRKYTEYDSSPLKMSRYAQTAESSITTNDDVTDYFRKASDHKLTSVTPQTG
jgi:hypothetical protein